MQALERLVKLLCEVSWYGADRSKGLADWVYLWVNGEVCVDVQVYGGHGCVVHLPVVQQHLKQNSHLSATIAANVWNFKMPWHLEFL
jgi:hypothetical protein